MRGLQEQTQAGTIFLKIKHSSICEESKQELPGFEPVEVTNPRTGENLTKFVKRYKGVEALVCKVEWYEREYEGTPFMGWNLHLDAAGVPCVLDLPLKSRVTSRFMKLAENIDFTRPVEFSAWHDKKSDSTAFNVRQDGESVPQKYTREDPGDCPPPVQSKVTKKWNFEEQTEYLVGVMNDVIIPAVEAAGNDMPDGSAVAAVAAHPNGAHARPALPQGDLEDDEIPF
jgi:hypothetical protein